MTTNINWAIATLERFVSANQLTALYIDNIAVLTLEVQSSGGDVLVLPERRPVVPGAGITTIHGFMLSMRTDPLEILFQTAASTPFASSTSSAVIKTSSTVTPISSSQATLSSPKSSASAIVDDNRRPISPGAIAGVVIGAILVILLILGGWFFMRRRSLRNRARLENTDESLPELLSSNKTSGGNEKYAYQSDETRLPELNDTGRPHELDPSQAQLLADTSRGQMRLVDNGSERGGWQGDVIPAQDDNLDGLVERQGDPSFHVQAQKKREVEWLEMEEARLRQRREQLLQGSTCAD